MVLDMELIDIFIVQRKLFIKNMEDGLFVVKTLYDAI